MIYREDMLELTRRMTPTRASFTRIAGCYIDSDGEIDGSFNTNFLNLSMEEKEKNIALAKAIPFSKANEELKQYKLTKQDKAPGSMWQLLMGIRACGLKNDALMYNFYELVAEQYKTGQPYAIFVFHDRYDVPIKGADKVRLGESEETYEYLICAVCPLVGEYEPGKPQCGFLFPSFANRSCDMEHLAIYSADQNAHEVIAKIILNGDTI